MPLPTILAVDDLIHIKRHLGIVDAPCRATTCSPVPGQTQRRGIALQKGLGAGLPERLLGDPQRLAQILINLLGNALRFTREGGWPWMWLWWSGRRMAVTLACIEDELANSPARAPSEPAGSR